MQSEHKHHDCMPAHLSTIPTQVSSLLYIGGGRAKSFSRLKSGPQSIHPDRPTSTHEGLIGVAALAWINSRVPISHALPPSAGCTRITPAALGRRRRPVIGSQGLHRPCLGPVDLDGSPEHRLLSEWLVGGETTSAPS